VQNSSVSSEMFSDASLSVNNFIIFRSFNEAKHGFIIDEGWWVIVLIMLMLLCLFN
jgi:hypothetical protein